MVTHHSTSGRAQIATPAHHITQGEFRAIVFGLCYFHACLLERKKFGVGNLPGSTSGIGWNMNYPFNTGDLLCCGQTAHNYLENNVKVRSRVLFRVCLCM